MKSITLKSISMLFFIVVSFGSWDAKADDLDKYAPATDQSDEALMDEYFGSTVAEMTTVMVQVSNKLTDRAPAGDKKLKK